MTEKETRPTETPLESWKDIAAYLKRDVRTVKRWEKSEALPVRRHLHQARSSVYAYPGELDAWRARRQPIAEKPGVLLWRPLQAATLGVVLLLALASAGSGPMRIAAAEVAGDKSGPTTRKVLTKSGAIYGSPSPDGRLLTYVDWSTGDLAVHDLKTGRNRRITKSGNLSTGFATSSVISPDGKQVAYAWTSDGEQGRFTDLHIANLDGSNVRILYQRHDAIQSAHPAEWSRDGRQILAKLLTKDGINQIAFVSVSDGSARVVKTLDSRGGGKLSLSPDGRYIAYSFPTADDPEHRDIYLLAADGSREIPLVQHPAEDQVAGWAPDGKSLLFISDRTGTRDLWLLAVADGRPQGQPVLVKHNIGKVVPIGFAQTGAFFYGFSTSLSNFYIANSDPVTGQILSPPKPATQRSVHPYSQAVWSPDGRHLAYILAAGLHNEKAFVIRSLETGQERQFPENFYRIFSNRFGWSPDGRSLLVAGYDTVNHQAIFRVDVRTGELTTLVERKTFDGQLAEPAWAPDGKVVFYRRLGAGNCVVRQDLETGELKEVLRGEQIGWWAVSPDGRRLAFLARTGKDVRYPTVLKVVPVAGGEPRQLLTVQEPQFLSEVAWTPDGRHLLFFTVADRNEKADTGEELDMTKELCRISADGGPVQTIDLPFKKLMFPSIHPNGRQIGFTAGEGQATEIWVIEDFLPKPKV